jgi:acyl-coenzyme A synthetase/AMP-(fatty) acid ligase
MDGYWGAPELTESVMRTDLVPGRTVYRTGDLVYRNEHGHYVYVDRADRVVKRFGVRISLLELANALHSLDGVSAAACVVFDDDGEVGIAAFVTTDGTRSALELRTSVRQQLPDTMLPDQIVLVDELPLTSASKLDERRLLVEAGLRELPAATGSTTTRHPARVDE